MWFEDSVAFGSGGEAGFSRYECYCAVILGRGGGGGRGAEVACQTLLVLIRQDETKMRFQSFVALDPVVVVGDVKKKFPSFWRYLAEGCAAVESVETVICGVSRERHRDRE